MSVERPSFHARAAAGGLLRRAGEVMVTVTHLPSSTTYLLTAAEAREWAYKLLAAVQAPVPAVYAEPEEQTRRQCSKCLKDCSACSCVEDVISKGKGA